MSDGDHTCKRCDREYRLRDNQEPTKFCDRCAHEVLDELEAKVRQLSSLAEEGALLAVRYGVSIEQEPVAEDYARRVREELSRE